MRWPMRIMDRNVHARLRHCLPWPMRFLDAHDFGQQIISSGAPKQNLFAFGENRARRALYATENSSILQLLLDFRVQHG